MKSVKQITDKLLCSGCGTCNVICARNAISMKKTPTMGLLYAEIDSTKCTDCGLCLKMCPSANILDEKAKVTKEQIISDVKACYVGRSQDREIFDNAQSGGFVTTMLKYLFRQGLIDAAVSCRMDYTEPRPYVYYTIITSADQLYKNQKSCYTQVDIVSALRETSEYERVAVVGVPCQIQGISNLMQLKKFSNIKYRIGLICDKTYSDAYMDAIMYGVDKPQGPIRINYRQKNFTHNGTFHSYQKAPTVIINEQGDMVVVPNSKRMFLKDYFSLPKCKICWDKLNVQADIVLGDPWGLKGMYDENEGDSVIIIRSEVAESLILDMSNANLIKLHDVSLEDVERGQHVEARVKSIHDFNVKKKQEEWQKYESQSKEDLIRKINFAYKRKQRMSKIKTIIKRILKIK